MTVIVLLTARGAFATEVNRVTCELDNDTIMNLTISAERTFGELVWITGRYNQNKSPNIQVGVALQNDKLVIKMLQIERYLVGYEIDIPKSFRLGERLETIVSSNFETGISTAAPYKCIFSHVSQNDSFGGNRPPYPSISGPTRFE